MTSFHLYHSPVCDTWAGRLSGFISVFFCLLNMMDEMLGERLTSWEFGFRNGQISLTLSQLLTTRVRHGLIHWLRQFPVTQQLVGVYTGRDTAWSCDVSFQCPTPSHFAPLTPHLLVGDTLQPFMASCRGCQHYTSFRDQSKLTSCTVWSPSLSMGNGRIKTKGYPGYFFPRPPNLGGWCCIPLSGTKGQKQGDKTQSVSFSQH